MYTSKAQVETSSRSSAETSCSHCSYKSVLSFPKVDSTFMKGGVWIWPFIYSLAWEGDERWIHNSHFSVQQDTHSLKTRRGSSEDTSSPVFLHEFTPLATNEESEDFMLKIRREKDRKMKLHISSTQKADMRKWRFLFWFPIFFFSMLICEITIEFSFLLYSFCT